MKGTPAEKNKKHEECTQAIGREQRSWRQLCHFCNEPHERELNTYIGKTGRHKITSKSGAAHSQIDYILYRSSDKRNVKECKVILGESVRPLVGTLISSNASERNHIECPSSNGDNYLSRRPTSGISFRNRQA